MSGMNVRLKDAGPSRLASCVLFSLAARVHTPSYPAVMPSVYTLAWMGDAMAAKMSGAGPSLEHIKLSARLLQVFFVEHLYTTRFDFFRNA